MKKSIVIFSAIGLGHIKPLLAVSKQLCFCGFSVYFYAASEYRPLVEQTGACFKSMWGYEKRYRDYLLPVNITYTNIALKQGIEGIAEYVKSVLKLNALCTEIMTAEIKALGPSCIIFDHVLHFPKQISYKLNIPAVSIATDYAYSPVLLEKHPEYTLKKYFQILDNDSLNYAEIYEKIKKLSKECGQECGILPFDQELLINNMLSFTDYNIVFSVKEFQLYPDCFDDTFYFCGSYTQEIDEDKLKQICTEIEYQKSDQIIYISFGTSPLVNNNPDFLLKLF